MVTITKQKVIKHFDSMKNKTIKKGDIVVLLQDLPRFGTLNPPKDGVKKYIKSGTEIVIEAVHYGGLGFSGVYIDPNSKKISYVMLSPKDIQKKIND